MVASIAVVLFVTWGVAAVFTKLVLFEQTRLFLVDRATNTAQNWLELAKSQDLKPSIIAGTDNEALTVWDKDRLILRKGALHHPSLRERPQESSKQILRLGTDQWIVVARCVASFCVQSALRDTDRKYAVRWLVASIYLPLLAIFALAMAGIFLALRYGLAPLQEVTDEVANLDFAKLHLLPKRQRASEIAPLAEAIDGLTVNLKDQLNRERRFLDTCAHEIRTPVAGLVSQLQMLEHVTPSDCNGKQGGQFTRVRTAALRVIRITNQFLTLAKTQNTLADPSRRTSFDVCELVRATIADMLNATNHVEFQLSGHTHLEVKTNPVAMELITQNLIDNALRYGAALGGQSSKIMVSFSNDGNQMTMRVEDNGPGVPEDIREQLSERFFRFTPESGSSTSESDRPERGAGLGLNIVREIVESCDGRLSFSKSSVLGGLSANVELKILSP